MSDEIYTAKFSQPPPNRTIRFHKDGNSEPVGTFDFNGPQMIFTGDADESAKVFIRFVSERWDERLKQERAEEREACARVCDSFAETSQHTLNLSWNCAAAIRARGEK